MIIDEEEYLAHYGILRRSGRYPWGSGGNQATRNRTFLDIIEADRKSGESETQTASKYGLTTTQLRAAKSIAKAQQKQAQISRAQQLHDRGHSNIAIGKLMGINESSVRALLAPGQKDKADVLETTANMLKDQVAKKGLLDVGVGVERHIGVSQTKLNTAVARLKEEGYEVHYVKVEQLGTGKFTTVKVLAPPGTTSSQAFHNRHNIKPITDVSDDGGRTFFGIQPPRSISSNRVAVRYADQGGRDTDGVIYVRPGVKDVSLGNSRYAQVRIAVDGTHFIKGMAMYKDDLPAGVDLMFNTSKHNTGNKMDAFKPLKDDPDNPFGAAIKAGGQQLTRGRDGRTKVTSVMNIVNDETNWETWSRSLSSQFLSKQSPKLAQGQLDMKFEQKRDELDSIMSMTNPAVRRKLLEAFADSADSSAVHLKAAALPRQKSHVILPVQSMKDNEVYAPNYQNGERVVLIRHPHGGIFELPELTVNNRNPEAKRLLGNAPNAIGINSKVAQHLSGADFDGDTVIVVPNNRGQIKTKSALAELKGFDPIASYKLPDDSPIPRMTARTKQHQMGVVSNLITDMTIHGASDAELARAVRHSMVVIDAEKHNLNYRQSALDNGIAQLSQKYQGKASGGAATLISRASSEKRVDERRARPASKGGPIDKRTGEKVFEPTGRTFVNSKGKVVKKQERTTKLAEARNAHDLSSGTPIERIYADHSNRMKALANKARQAAVNTKGTPYSPSARTAYAKEVASLNAKLNIALKNAPLERNAQVLANRVLSQKRQANPDMDPADLKRVKSQALFEARNRTGAGKDRIQISDSEWKAIQAGAISNDKLTKILNNADLDVVKQHAAPKQQILMTSAKTQRAKAMIAAGYTQAEVANALGVSLTTLKEGIR